MYIYFICIIKQIYEHIELQKLIYPIYIIIMINVRIFCERLSAYDTIDFYSFLFQFSLMTSNSNTNIIKINN